MSQKICDPTNPNPASGMEEGITEVHRHAAFLNGVIASALDAIIAIDSTHRITRFKSSAENMFGLTSDEMLGSSGRLIPSRFRATHSDQVHRFGKTTFSKRVMDKSGEIFRLHSDGREFPVDASLR
jgi:PAS domain S-box-containing protein